MDASVSSFSETTSVGSWVRRLQKRARRLSQLPGSSGGVHFPGLRVWVSDNATHVKNRLLRKVAAAQGIAYEFTLADSAWTNGTVKRVMR